MIDWKQVGKRFTSESIRIAFQSWVGSRLSHAHALPLLLILWGGGGTLAQCLGDELRRGADS